MSDERIDIEVTDKVDGNISKKLNLIADAADKGYTHVDKLKAALASINTSEISKLSAESAKLSNALAREMNAQARLTTVRDKAALSDAKAALAQQKLATETARTEAAQARAATATAQSEAAALRLSLAQAKAATSAASAATAEQRLAADLEAVRQRFAAGEINIRTYVQELQRLNGAAASAGTGAKGAGAGLDEFANKAQKARNVNANIIAQLQDIGVSLAGGQNPFLVLIQQGSQLSYIATTMDGGFKALTVTILRMLAPFTVLAGLVGAVYVGFKNFNADMGTKYNDDLKAYAASLGLTEKEMRKLDGATVGANGKLKEQDVLVITMGDTWNGFIATVQQGLDGLLGPFQSTFDWVGSAWDKLMGFLKAAFIGFYASVRTFLDLIGNGAVNMVKIAINAIMGLANSVIMVIQDAINIVVGGINLLASGAQAAMNSLGFDTVISKLDAVNLGVTSIDQNFLELNKTGKTFGETFTGYGEEALNTINGFSKAWDQNTKAAARARVANLAAAIIENRGPGKKTPEDKTAENRAHAIDQVNLKLDNELARMKLLKDERAVQQRMDQIEEQLANKKIKLNQTERQTILDKVKAIEAYKYVQSEMDRIYEEATGPQRTWEAAQKAAKTLLDAGTISLEQYNAELVKSGRSYQEATNPLFALNEQMAQAEAAAKLYGNALAQNNYYEQIRSAYLAKGIELSPQYVAGLNAEVDALMRRNAALTQQQLIQSTVAGIVDPITQDQQMLQNKIAYYDELERLRQEDQINEKAYQQARYQLDYMYSQKRLENASSMFGDLASLSQSGNKKLAAIGKAAAIVQATIDGYLAVQKALASAPPPLNFAMAAAVAVKTGMTVASIASQNVGSFATGGQFMVDGKSGVDANNINMNVTKGERVTIETPAQQRANDAAAQGQGGSPEVNLSNVVVFDPKLMLAALDTAEGRKNFISVAEQVAPELKQILGA